MKLQVYDGFKHVHKCILDFSTISIGNGMFNR